MDNKFFSRKQGRRSVLVVGSKTQATLSICMLLKRFAYEVSTADTAAKALDLVTAAAPALIITDPVLPGMSGMDLFNVLRQVKRTSSIPVIFMVPMSDAAAERRCIESGAAGCISKPVLAEELYRTIQTILEPIPRENIRIGARLVVSVDNAPLDCSEGACSIDLSEQGMYVPMYKPFPRNRRLTVQLQIKDRTISTESTVLYNYASRVGSDQESGVGLKFVAIALQDREYIRKFIREEIARDVRESISGQLPDTWR